MPSGRTIELSVEVGASELLRSGGRGLTDRTLVDLLDLVHFDVVIDGVESSTFSDFAPH